MQSLVILTSINDHTVIEIDITLAIKLMRIVSQRHFTFIVFLCFSAFY